MFRFIIWRAFPERRDDEKRPETSAVMKRLSLCDFKEFELLDGGFYFLMSAWVNLR